ncbi:MAG: NUDIX domain-containing protein [Acidimicrobiales bacterium]|nr:NUDIX domain-containing protein [Acidimicrobiales bacterium]MCB9372795.1 NUDIX domain-containing protein [Microthrixaceae bacterium]
MPARLHRFALRCYQRLPTLGRRWVVRTIAPSYTVGAMCVIERRDGAVLLIRHSYRSRWGVPGGLLNRREEPADAARREVWEEVGLDVELAGEPAPVVDAVPQRVDLVYRARPAAGADLDAVRPVSPEIAEVRWFPPDELPELQVETTTALIALARAANEPRPGWEVA